MKRVHQTPVKQLGLDGIAKDKIVVPWPVPKQLFAGTEAVTPEAVERAAEAWHLNAGQTEVARAIYLGKLASNAAIAAYLGFSRRTVEKHFEALFDCAGVNRRVALILEIAEFEHIAQTPPPLHRVEDAS